MRKFFGLVGLLCLVALPVAAQEGPKSTHLSVMPADVFSPDSSRVTAGNASLALPTGNVLGVELPALPAPDGSFLLTEAPAPLSPSSPLYTASLAVPSPKPQGGFGEYNNMFGVEFVWIGVREDVTASPNQFNHYGVDFTYVRWLLEWIGFEGNVGFVFGSVQDSSSGLSADTRIVTYGAAIRLAGNRKGRFSPWASVGGGGASLHASFPSGGGSPAFSDSENAGYFKLTGGLNVNLSPRFTWKVFEAGYLLTRFLNDKQHNIIGKAGVYINF